MRSKRTLEENLAIEILLDHLTRSGEKWTEDASITDVPDLVLDGLDKRVACEITSVGLQAVHKWSKDPREQLEIDQLDRILIPREPDVWVEKVIRSKNPKVDKYKSNANARECWLLIEDGNREGLFCLDELDFDIPLMQQSCCAISHNFDRIYAISFRTRDRKCVRVFPPSFAFLVPPDLNDPMQRRTLTISSVTTQLLDAGVREVRLGSKEIPDRRVILPPIKYGRFPKI